MNKKQIEKAFRDWEKQEHEIYKGMSRAIDLEQKIGAANWYRVYRWPDAGMVMCVSMLDRVCRGMESCRPNAHASELESELIAAASAFWMMQDQRRLHFLEGQKSIHNQQDVPQ